MGIIPVEIIANGMSPETELRIENGLTYVYYDGHRASPLGQKYYLPVKYVHPEPGYSFGRCRVITREGDRCKLPVAQGYTYCQKHGAHSGIATNLKHGKYSKHLPTRLLAQYEESLQDPGILNLEHEIALMDAKIAEELQELEGGNPLEAIGYINQAYNLINMAESTDDVDIGAIRNLLGEAMHAATTSDSVWRAIVTLVEERRRLVDTERRRMSDTGQYLTVAEANALIAYLVNTVLENITDKSVLDAITSRLRIFASGNAT